MQKLEVGRGERTDASLFVHVHKLLVIDFTQEINRLRRRVNEIASEEMVSVSAKKLQKPEEGGELFTNAYSEFF